MTTACSEQLTLWDLGSQQVTVDFQGGCLVSDAGLLAIRSLDKELGVLARLAERLPDPRAQKFVVHSREALLTQQVYQILAGYADCNDAQLLRHDPLFQTVVDVSPTVEQPLASGSTLARFQHAFTRRQAEQPPEEREVLREVDAAQSQRLKILNDYLPELFIRTRRQVPAALTIDLDASDDPTHGQQILTGFHGYFDQHQYFPLFAFDGDTGLAADRWAFHRFRANALKLLEHTLAYALVVLHREATAAIAEVDRAEVATLRSRLWTVAAVVKTSVRRIWFHFSATWPYRNLWLRVEHALRQFVADVHAAARAGPSVAATLPM